MDAGSSLSPSRTACFVIGCCFWPSLFVGLWTCLANIYSESLACGTAMRLISSTHAVLTALGGFTVMCETYGDMFYQDCKILEQVLAFTGMYWIYDIVAMYIVYHKERRFTGSWVTFQTWRMFLRDSTLIVFHHLFVLVIGYPFVMYFRRGKGAFLLACVLLSELSTPFVNFRKILIKHGHANTFIFTLNNIIVTVVFFCARVILFPALYFIYGFSQQLTILQVVKSMYAGCHIGMFIVILLQTTWFVKFVLSLSKLYMLEPKTLQQNGSKSE